MAFCAGREDPRGWQDDGWSISENEQEDALFGSLDEDEETDQDEPLDELFSMEAVDGMPLNVVERLSWDAASEDSSDDEGGSQLVLPSMLPLQGGLAEGDTCQEWSLVSPCSETASPRPSMTALSPLTRVSISSPVRQMRFFEPEHEPTEQLIEVNGQQMIEEVEEEDEDVTPFDPETCWSPVLSPVVRANPFPTYQPAELAEEDNRSTNEIISDSDKPADKCFGSSTKFAASSTIRCALEATKGTYMLWGRICGDACACYLQSTHTLAVPFAKPEYR
ncbi:Hypothetical protein PHPALM_13407 [Phytophthora palmivora]|uniref:Uncharacterized protein n=1 Tax=Phytophthora palmivora TaxID=4796 RepID=A0A2P4XX95_9STRA|nr:Hypothetical protein PHPALM_13407 [Phytophthora palmivora]